MDFDLREGWGRMEGWKEGRGRGRYELKGRLSLHEEGGVQPSLAGSRTITANRRAVAAVLKWPPRRGSVVMVGRFDV